MKSRRGLREKPRALTAELHPDDGVDPREAFSRVQAAPEQGQRKTRQLCKQVFRALEYALGGECEDPLLRGLLMLSVVPAPDAAHLLVSVQRSADNVASGADVLARLERAKGLLRGEIAAAITRRRAPELRFQVV